MARRKRRWSDHDRHFGPFTYSTSGHGTGFVLDSGDEESPGCNLRLHAFRRTLIVELPAILLPHRQKVIAHTWDEATVARLGRDWYWLVHAREIGARLIDDMVHLSFGVQTHDSQTDRSKCWSLPWTRWRNVRHCVYGLRGELVTSEDRYTDWHAWFDARKACPSVSFEFDDFDGERIVARTHIEEREYRRGTRGWRWISYFCAPRIDRVLDLEFSKETGKRKGSWKGGTIGHAIDLRPGELHESAFRRYCAEHDMRFVGLAPASSAVPGGTET